VSIGGEDAGDERRDDRAGGLRTEPPRGEGVHRLVVLTA